MLTKLSIKSTWTVLIFLMTQNAWAVKENTGIWLDASTGDLIEGWQNWSYALEAQLHFLDKSNHYESFYLQGKLNYHYRTDLNISAGYQWSSHDAILGTSPFNILFEELYWWPTIYKHFVFRSRTRFEQINQLHQPEWENRARQRMSFYFPNVISDKITPLIYDEIYFKLNNPEWDSHTDSIQQNIIFMGLDVVIVPTWFITVGYINQYVFAHPNDHQNNVLYFGINYNPQKVPDYIYIK